MRNLTAIFLFIFTMLLSSCSTVHFTSRSGKDISLNSSDFIKLKGTYSNMTRDTNHINRTLYNNFKYDSVYKQKTLTVNISPINSNTITINLLDNDKIFDSLTIKGKYSRGYFKIKRQWNTSFIAGPLLWILGDDLKYLGLTKENNLVIVNSGGGGVMLLIAIPIFAGGGGQYENEYVRMK